MLYVISYDEGYSLPYGVAAFDDIGNPYKSAFTYYATHAEAVAHFPNGVCLSDDTKEIA